MFEKIIDSYGISWYEDLDDSGIRILHREDGPAIEYYNGRKEWYFHGTHHREDGPAIITPDGSQYWIYKGKYHREDGPAVIAGDDSYQAWYLYDEKVPCSSKEEFERFVKLKVFW